MGVGQGNTMAPGVPTITRAQQAYEAYEAQRCGMKLREIGKMLGISHETVRTRISEYCDKLVLPGAAEYRKREVERCDHIIESLAGGVNKGDPAAANATINAMARRAKFLGLDAPIQIEAVVVQVTQEDQEFAAFLREERAREMCSSNTVDGEVVSQA